MIYLYNYILKEKTSSHEDDGDEKSLMSVTSIFVKIRKEKIIGNEILESFGGRQTTMKIF